MQLGTRGIPLVSDAALYSAISVCAEFQKPPSAESARRRKDNGIHACRTGYLGEFFHTAGSRSELVGVDLSPRMTAAASVKKFYRQPVTTEPILDFVFRGEEGSYDHIACYSTFHLCDNQTCTAIIAGIFILTRKFVLFEICDLSAEYLSDISNVRQRSKDCQAAAELKTQISGSYSLQTVRFINAGTLEFIYVPDSELGFEENKYAVLSHRWGAARDEVSFQDIEESREYSHKKGFAKLKGRRNGDERGDQQYVPLYEESYICIIYREDVQKRPLFDSVWSDRGWTLQKLIAPKEANFYDQNWQFIASKTGLAQDLSTKTGIPETVLNHTIKPSACSIAQRMSWAANRETTRVEDRAYSLAIIQQSKDETIFAWPMSDEPYTGLLARSPSKFAGCNDVISIRGSSGFSEANGELSIKLRTFPYGMETYCALLNCTREALPDARISIFLGRL
ncbi:MAG: hypothetical protein LQ339_005246 [Xanthoria mediterranea]|nr:MAG: hypothetical protein LQ339_005246 [Xanthoria mediterranea]